MSCGLVCNICQRYLPSQLKIIQPHLIACLADSYNLVTQRGTTISGISWGVNYAVNDPLLYETYVWCTVYKDVRTFHIRCTRIAEDEFSTFIELFNLVARDIRLKHEYVKLVGRSS